MPWRGTQPDGGPFPAATGLPAYVRCRTAGWTAQPAVLSGVALLAVLGGVLPGGGAGRRDRPGHVIGYVIGYVIRLDLDGLTSGVRIETFT